MYENNSMDDSLSLASAYWIMSAHTGSILRSSKVTNHRLTKASTALRVVWLNCWWALMQNSFNLSSSFFKYWARGHSPESFLCAVISGWDYNGSRFSFFIRHIEYTYFHTLWSTPLHLYHLTNLLNKCLFGTGDQFNYIKKIFIKIK